MIHGRLHSWWCYALLSIGGLLTLAALAWAAIPPGAPVVYTAPDTATVPVLRLVQQGSDAGLPAAGHWHVYTKSDGLYVRSPSGTVTGPFGVGGGAAASDRVALVATTGNVTLSGEQTIDDVLTSADRVLVWQQTNQTQNGVYLSAAGAWARVSDLDDSAEFSGNFPVFVQSGTLYGGRLFHFTTVGSVTLGATNLTFSPIGKLETVAFDDLPLGIGTDAETLYTVNGHDGTCQAPGALTSVCWWDGNSWEPLGAGVASVTLDTACAAGSACAFTALTQARPLQIAPLGLTGPLIRYYGLSGNLIEARLHGTTGDPLPYDGPLIAPGDDYCEVRATLGNPAAEHCVDGFTVTEAGGFGTGITRQDRGTYANLPVLGIYAGQTYTVTDCASAACTAGGGPAYGTVVAKMWNGTDWVNISGGTGGPGQTVVATETAPLRVTNAGGTSNLDLYVDTGTNDPSIRCTKAGVPCPPVVQIPAGSQFTVRNSLGAALFTIDEATGAFTPPLGGGGAPSFQHNEAMHLDTVNFANGNAFVSPQDRTNYDTNVIEFLDGVQGCAHFITEIPSNLSTTPSWRLVITHSAASGPGGNVLLTAAARSYNNNTTKDSAFISLPLANSGVIAVNTSANLTRTLLSSGTLDATEALIASSILRLTLCREGADASDTLGASWYLEQRPIIRYFVN